MLLPLDKVFLIKFHERGKRGRGSLTSFDVFVFLSLVSMLLFSYPSPSYQNVCITTCLFVVFFLFIVYSVIHFYNLIRIRLIFCYCLISLSSQIFCIVFIFLCIFSFHMYSYILRKTVFLRSDQIKRFKQNDMKGTRKKLSLQKIKKQKKESIYSILSIQIQTYTQYVRMCVDLRISAYNTYSTTRIHPHIKSHYIKKLLLCQKDNNNNNKRIVNKRKYYVLTWKIYIRAAAQKELNDRDARTDAENTKRRKLVDIIELDVYLATTTPSQTAKIVIIFK